MATQKMEIYAIHNVGFKVDRWRLLFFFSLSNNNKKKSVKILNEKCSIEHRND